MSTGIPLPLSSTITLPSLHDILRRLIFIAWDDSALSSEFMLNEVKTPDQVVTAAVAVRNIYKKFFPDRNNDIVDTFSPVHQFIGRYMRTQVSANGIQVNKRLK